MTTTEPDTIPDDDLEGIDPEALAAGFRQWATTGTDESTEAAEQIADMLEPDEAPVPAVPEQAAAPVPATRPAALVNFTPQQVQLLKDTICASAELTDDEFALFLEVCKRTGLDPFVGQIHPVKRNNRQLGRKVMTIQTGIDGYRLIAERTGVYAGQLGPYWCGPDGEWVDVWLDDDTPPTAARVGVLRADFAEVLWATARFTDYADTYNGQLKNLWRLGKDGGQAPLMVAKCAEALGLRRAFPNDLSGIYTDEEMDQADRDGGTWLPGPSTGPAPAPAAEPTTAEQRLEFAERIDRLEGKARTEFGQWWVGKGLGKVEALTKRQVPLVKAKLEQVEQAVLDGRYGDEAAATMRAAIDGVIDASSAEVPASDEQTADETTEAGYCDACERTPCGCPPPEGDEDPGPNEPALFADDPGRPFE